MPSNHTPIACDQSGHSLRILTPSLRILTPTLRILTPSLRILTPAWPLSPYGSRAKRHPQVILQVILQTLSLNLSPHFDLRSTGMPLTRQMPPLSCTCFNLGTEESSRFACQRTSEQTKRLNLGRTGLPYSFFSVSVNFNKSSVNNKTRR